MNFREKLIYVFIFIKLFFPIQFLFLVLLHIIFIGILVKCYSEDKQYNYYAAVLWMEFISLAGLTTLVLIYSLYFSGSPEIYGFISICFFVSMSCPYNLIFIDAVLCLHRVFSFFDVARGFCRNFKWPLGFAIFLSMPFVLIIYIYTTAYIFFSMTGDELYAANIALYKAPYEFSMKIKLILTISTPCGYLLILWKIHKQISTSSVSNIRGHKSIVLQALPISIYSLMTSFDVYLIPISLDYHVGEAGATLYLLSILMSAYVVPISFLIGNSQKRKMFLSLIRLDFMRNSKVHAESPATTN